MGNSSNVGENDSIEIYAKATAQLIEHLKLQPVALCGHHTGGVVAIELCATHPELVDTLILSSTPWIDKAAREKRAKKIPIDTIKAKKDGTHLTNLWRQRAPYYPDKIEYMERFLSDALKCSDPSHGHHAVGQYEMEKTISKILCPTLIIEHGNDPFSVKHTMALKKNLPKANIAYIPNGHVALEVTAPQFCKTLKEWVQKNSL